MIKTSLEQWEALRAVVEEGSFALAAERLNKSQSSVSYTLAKLQERVPVPIFEEGGRKAILTEAGKSLFRHALNLLSHAEQLDRTASYLATGWESEVVIAADALADLSGIFCSLHAFSKEHPQTRIRILETTLSGTDEAIISRKADIAICPRVPPGFLGKQFGHAMMRAVARYDHPLLQFSEISEQQLRLHRQLVVRDTGIKREQDGGWLGSSQRWTVSHFSSSIKAVKAGLGFAFIPQAFIENELASGELKVLPLFQGGERSMPLHLVLTGQTHAGEAARKVAEYLFKFRR